MIQRKQKRREGRWEIRCHMCFHRRSRYLVLMVENFWLLWQYWLSVLTVESQIGNIADFIPEQLDSSQGIAAFIGIWAIVTVTQYYILAFVKLNNKESRARTAVPQFNSQLCDYCTVPINRNHCTGYFTDIHSSRV